MGRRRQKRWGMPEDRREPLGARIGLLLVLLNIFIWLGFRFVVPVVVSGVGTVMALAGLLLARKAELRIRKYQGRIAGEHLAMIAVWGNLILLILNALLFCYLFGTRFVMVQLL